MSARCKTGKRRFPDEEAAKVALVASRAAQALRRSTKRREERVYQCEFCRGWHLTSQPYAPKGGAA